MTNLFFNRIISTARKRIYGEEIAHVRRFRDGAVTQLRELHTRISLKSQVKLNSFVLSTNYTNIAIGQGKVESKDRR